MLAGGNVRVGLEDNLWLGKGQLATNGALVERAATIVTNMGARVLGPDEVRAKLKLREAGLRWLRSDSAAVVGGGVIGGGWAARLVQNGIDVAVYDPDPEAERKIGEVLAHRRPRLRQAHQCAAQTRRGALRFAASDRGGGARRRLHPGERAGAAGAEAKTLRRDRPPRAAATR